MNFSVFLRDFFKAMIRFCNIEGAWKSIITITTERKKAFFLKSTLLVYGPAEILEICSLKHSLHSTSLKAPTTNASGSDWKVGGDHIFRGWGENTLYTSRFIRGALDLLSPHGAKTQPQ